MIQGICTSYYTSITNLRKFQGIIPALAVGGALSGGIYFLGISCLSLSGRLFSRMLTRSGYSELANKIILPSLLTNPWVVVAVAVGVPALILLIDSLKRAHQNSLGEEGVKETQQKAVDEWIDNHKTYLSHSINVGNMDKVISSQEIRSAEHILRENKSVSYRGNRKTLNLPKLTKEQIDKILVLDEENEQLLQKLEEENKKDKKIENPDSDTKQAIYERQRAIKYLKRLKVNGIKYNHPMLGKGKTQPGEYFKISIDQSNTKRQKAIAELSKELNCSELVIQIAIDEANKENGLGIDDYLTRKHEKWKSKNYPSPEQFLEDLRSSVIDSEGQFFPGIRTSANSINWRFGSTVVMKGGDLSEMTGKRRPWQNNNKFFTLPLAQKDTLLIGPKKELEQYDDILMKKGIRFAYLENLTEKQKTFFNVTKESLEASMPLSYMEKANKARYPQQFETKAPADDKGMISCPLLRDSKDLFKDKYAQIKSLEDLKGKIDFKMSDQPFLYDIYDMQFQNLAIKLTKDLQPEELLKLQYSSFGEMLVYRARSIAIASRTDYDWNGKSISHDSNATKQKQAEMQKYYQSFRIYNTLKQDSTFKTPNTYKGGENLPPTIKVSYQTTAQALSLALKRDAENAKEWAALIMANTERMGGGHQKTLGTQEEQTGGDSGLFPILGTTSKRSSEGEKGRVVYEDGYALPPGGVAYLDTRLFDGSNDGKGVECSFLVAGFADFRPTSPESELAEYSDDKGNLKIDEKYEKRIGEEIEAVLACAVKHNKRKLILGASGCGAFAHDPKAEALAWQKALENHNGDFDEIEFAIYDQKVKTIFEDVFK